MKILISAYGCEPNKGSEPGIGWHWCLQLAKFGDIYVITRSNNEENICNGLRQQDKNIVKHIHFYYYDTGNILKRIKKGEHNLYLYYYFWQLGSLKVAKELCQKNRFDYCIALTFGSVWMPTFMHRLNIPFIWGPIGGGEAVPDEYLSLLDKESSIVQYVRKAIIKTAPINPLVMNPVRNAKAIIARTDDTANIFPKKYRNKIHICLETSIDLKEVIPKDYDSRPANRRKCCEKIKMVYTGRLIKQKGLELVLKAIAECEMRESLEFLIIGSGDQENSLLALSKKLGLKDNVHFLGKKDRFEVLHILRECDIYVFPSLKEGGSWGLMEGMGAALPVICIDTSGMHIITDDSCAIRIPISLIDNTIQEFKFAIEKLAADEELRESMGKAARNRIEMAFNWDAKGKFLEENIFSV